VDLSRTPFDLACVLDRLRGWQPGDLICLSPLTQNHDLALGVAQEFRRRRGTVAVGGKIAHLVVAEEFGHVFPGRIETQPGRFLPWVDELVGITPPAGKGDFIEGMACRLDHGWARHDYGADMMYLRSFAYHGCPFACTFCADRLSGSLVVD